MRMDQRGQSTIEFILTFVFGIAFLFLFVNQAINMTTGYVMHYATFLASRVYLTHDTGSNNVASAYNEAAAKARSAFNSLPLDPFQRNVSEFHVNALIPSTGIDVVGLYEYVGVWYKYERPLSVLNATRNVRFISESFLGKEPTRSECHCMMQHAAAMPQGTSCFLDYEDQINYDVTLFDNGC